METHWILSQLWLIPVLPLCAAALLALLPRPLLTGNPTHANHSLKRILRHRPLALTLPLLAMLGSFVLSLFALCHSINLQEGRGIEREFFNFPWFWLGNSAFELGFLLDPLSATLLATVTFVSIPLLFFSASYMGNDRDFNHFFSLVSFLLASILGLIISNHFLLFFICWKLSGLATYLLIGFWFQKNNGAEAARKFFVVSNIGDVALLLGILWLQAQAGTLLFYNNGSGCLEPATLSFLGSQFAWPRFPLNGVIGLLIGLGALIKSAQFPLHGWLADASESPTPTMTWLNGIMIAPAGVFLLARVYPLLNPQSFLATGTHLVLHVILWIGIASALLFPLIAIVQVKLKKNLAFLAMSQLGWMWIGLGTGESLAGVYHLVAYSLFMPLLFMATAAITHACHGEMDIRKMGGLFRNLPITFGVYLVGAFSLCGVPIFFGGFWSQNIILYNLKLSTLSDWPLLLFFVSHLLCIIAITRQVHFIFLGRYRMPLTPNSTPREVTWIILIPMSILALSSLLIGLLGTPAFPAFRCYLTGIEPFWNPILLLSTDALLFVLEGTLICALGTALVLYIYGFNPPPKKVRSPDALTLYVHKDFYKFLKQGMRIDALYRASFTRLNYGLAHLALWIEEKMIDKCVWLLSLVFVVLGYLCWAFDKYLLGTALEKSFNFRSLAEKFSSPYQLCSSGNRLRIVSLALLGLLFLSLVGLLLLPDTTPLK